MGVEFAYISLLALVAALVVLVLVILMRRHGGGASAVALSERAQALEVEVAQLRDGKGEAERRLAAEERTAGRVPDLERELRDHKTQLQAVGAAKAGIEIDLAKAKEAAAHVGEALDTSQKRIADLEAAGREAALRLEAVLAEKADVEEALAAKTASLDASGAQIIELKERLDAAMSQHAELSDRLEAMGCDKGQLEVQLAKSLTMHAEKSDAVGKLQGELEAEKAQHDAVRKAVAELSAGLAAANEKLEQEMSKAAEKIALLTEAREAMANEFKVLAEGVMARHGEVFTKQNKEQVEGILTPLREKLVEFQQGLQTAQTDAAKERATLAEQIRSLSEASTRMTTETHNLTKALKGKAQTQGAWGEMILTTILEKSGLREGDEYVKQESHTDEEGGRYRPDVIVNLPGGQRVVIDAKVSLTAFEEHVNATAEQESAAALLRHLNSLRGHIRMLASKEYQAVVGGGLDYVIMFIPIEGALAVALQEQPGLTAEAVGTNVAIATPTTLMMALRTIANVWSVERRNRNADAIAERAGKLYDKFTGFIGDMNTLGSQLDRAKGSFDDAMGKLSSGRGNLVRQVESLKELGAKTTKAIPTVMLDDAIPDKTPLPVPSVTAAA